MLTHTRTHTQGAIGLTVARRAAFVVGLEINERAVVDARANARANGIENAEFVAGRAECTIGRALGKYMGGGAGGRGGAAGVRFDRAVAIVDPPRGGLHADVLRALRRAGGIERLVYVSCNVESLVDNAVELCTPGAREQLAHTASHADARARSHTHTHTHI